MYGGMDETCPLCTGGGGRRAARALPGSTRGRRRPRTRPRARRTPRLGARGTRALRSQGRARAPSRPPGTERRSHGAAAMEGSDIATMLGRGREGRACARRTACEPAACWWGGWGVRRGREAQGLRARKWLTKQISSTSNIQEKRGHSREAYQKSPRLTALAEREHVGGGSRGEGPDPIPGPCAGSR